MYSFLQLKPEYTALLTRMAITRPADVNEAAGRLINFIDAGRYKAGCDATGVPQILAAASFEREASSDFSLNAAQGWPLNSRSQWQPYNGPFNTWTASQIAAYQIDSLDNVGKNNWTWELACYYEEKFNGFGPRDRGIHTGYLWSGTNNYSHGKYIADGVWSSYTVDQQLGVIPMMFRIIKLRPDLDLPSPFPTTSLPSPPVQNPNGLSDTEQLQAALNKLGASPPLTVDGSYGRFTTAAVRVFQKANGLAVDGLSGPLTWDAIMRALASHLREPTDQQGWPIGGGPVE